MMEVRIRETHEEYRIKLIQALTLRKAKSETKKLKISVCPLVIYRYFGGGVKALSYQQRM